MESLTAEWVAKAEEDFAVASRELARYPGYFADRASAAEAMATAHEVRSRCYQLLKPPGHSVAGGGEQL